MERKMKKLAILVPAYEPDEKLPNFIKNLTSLGVDIVVVDDGSGAHCKQFFEQIQEYCKILTHEVNKGKGAALKTGISYLKDCGYAGVVTADSDGQHCVDDIKKLLTAMEEYPNSLILGVRDVSKMPKKSRVGNSLTRRLFHMLYDIKVTDTQTGLRGIPLGECSEPLLNLSGDRYEYEMNMLIFSHQIFSGDIIEIPIETIYFDNNEKSHFRPIKDGLKIYIQIFKYLPGFMLASFGSFLIDYVLFNGLFFVAGIGTVLSTLIARVISASCNYYFNKHLVFRSEKYNIINYFLLAACILCVNMGMMFVLVDIIHFPAYLAKLIVECLLYIVSFTVQNRWASK